MEITYHSSMKGKKFYRVLKGNGVAIFLGTMGECRRFLKVHQEKVKKHFAKSSHKPQELLELLTSDFGAGR